MPSKRQYTTIVLVVIVAALGLGRDLFLPLFLAAFVAFLLAPIAAIAERRLKFPTTLAVATAVFVATVVIGAIGYVVAIEAVDVAEKLPKYKENLSRKLGAVRAVKKQIEDVTSDIEKIKEEVSDAASGSGETKEDPATDEREKRDAADEEVERAVAVKVVERREPTIVRFATNFLSPFAGIVGTLAIILVFVPFLLLARKSLRDRLIRILSMDNVYLTARAVDEATERVSSYLLTTVLVNAAYGVPVGIGLHLIGLPNAFLWGLMAMLLRFIPYIGPWVAAVLPISLAIAVFPGWGPVWMVIGLILVLEILTSNVLEPWLYGKRTGLSTLAVLLAAFFWSWLWGPAGLFLAVPITLCLAVAGRYVPRLSFLHILLSNDDRVAAHTPMFQRLLVRDVEGASRLANTHLANEGWTSLVDRVFLPALRVCEQEHVEGVLEPERAVFVLEELVRIAQNLPQSKTDSTGRYRAMSVVSSKSRTPYDEAHARIAEIGANALGVPAKPTEGDTQDAARVRVLNNADVLTACKNEADHRHAVIWVREPIHNSETAETAECVYVATFADLLYRLSHDLSESGTPVAMEPVTA